MPAAYGDCSGLDERKVGVGIGTAWGGDNASAEFVGELESVSDAVDLFVVIDRAGPAVIAEVGDVGGIGRRVDGRLEVIATDAGDEDFWRAACARKAAKKFVKKGRP